MALKTLGTNATTTLSAFVMDTNTSAADYAQVAAHILNDKINGFPIYPGAFAKHGLLYIPNRGVLHCEKGDYVAYDASGWPILLSANAIASGSTSWTHS
jgi:hypothetical protein